MRVMNIQPFPRVVEGIDVNALIRSRLSQEIVLWPWQAVPLACYMSGPNDESARNKILFDLQSWNEGTATEVDELRRIQYEWRLIADIVHTYLDLVAGAHQLRRGGPSVGKAVTLVARKAESDGTGESNLWRHWATYKDVAHLITAAAHVCHCARRGAKNKSFGTTGNVFHQLYPFQMVMKMPDLVLAFALDIQTRGLASNPEAIGPPIFDADTLWHIPPDTNVSPIALPARPIEPDDLKILNDRRAGNRGKANRRETTPTF